MAAPTAGSAGNGSRETVAESAGDPTPVEVIMNDSGREEEEIDKLTERVYSAVATRLESHTRALESHAEALENHSKALEGHVKKTLSPPFTITWCVVLAALLCLGSLGYAVYDLRRVVQDRTMTIKESAVATAVRDIRVRQIEIENLLIALRAGVPEYDKLEQGARLPAPCPSLPTWEEVKAQFQRATSSENPPERDIAVIVSAIRRYNICDLSYLGVPLKDAETQQTIADIYRRVLKRRPDQVEQVTWGWRLMHGFKPETVEKLISASEEARGHP
jgi:hypothetical protein